MRPHRIHWDPYEWWDVIFAAAVLTGALVVKSLGEAPTAYYAYAALAVMCVAWIFLGRKPAVVWPQEERTNSPGDRSPFDSQESALSNRYFWHGAVFVIIMVASVGIVSFTAPMATFFLIFACPYIWSWPEGRDMFRIAVAFNALLCLVAVIGIWGHTGWKSTELLSAFASGVVSFLFSVGMGMWIMRIARGAEEQGRLQAELDATTLELVEAHRQAGAATERERFAHEIHDTLTQTLTGVVMLTERARGELERGDIAIGTTTLATAERTARQALAETRSLIAEGRGVELGAKQFLHRIMDICGRFQEETGVAVEQEISGELDALPRADQVVLLRCLQETLSNVRKHARASCVVVELSGNADDGVYLAVTDDGVGFPDSVDAATERGYGLAGIASRLALSTGTMTITTGEEGTRVSVAMPGKTKVGGTQPSAAEGALEENDGKGHDHD